MDNTDFQLSRVYAQGWNVARKAVDLEPEDGAKLNPYPKEPQRSRWNEGFAGALGKAISTDDKEAK